MATGKAADPSTDLTAILSRLGALESDKAKLAEHVADLEGHLKDGEALEEIHKLITDLTARLEAHHTALGDHSAALEKITGTLAAETVELIDGGEATSGDQREPLLKAFRQIEAIANQLNIRLPA